MCCDITEEEKLVCDEWSEDKCNDCKKCSKGSYFGKEYETDEKEICIPCTIFGCV